MVGSATPLRESLGRWQPLSSRTAEREFRDAVAEFPGKVAGPPVEPSLSSRYHAFSMCLSCRLGAAPRFRSVSSGTGTVSRSGTQRYAPKTTRSSEHGSPSFNVVTRRSMLERPSWSTGPALVRRSRRDVPSAEYVPSPNSVVPPTRTVAPRQIARSDEPTCTGRSDSTSVVLPALKLCGEGCPVILEPAIK